MYLIILFPLELNSITKISEVAEMMCRITLKVLQISSSHSKPSNSLGQHLAAVKVPTLSLYKAPPLCLVFISAFHCIF